MTRKRHLHLWILIADGEHARVVTPSAAAQQFTTVWAADSAAAHLRAAEMGSDRPGRTFESASITRHAIAPRSDPHLKAKHHFAQELARIVGEYKASGDFKQLVLVAPDHVLHDLKEMLGKQADIEVIGTLPKDLVKVPDHDLTPFLGHWWAAP